MIRRSVFLVVSSVFLHRRHAIFGRIPRLHEDAHTPPHSNYACGRPPITAVTSSWQAPLHLDRSGPTHHGRICIRMRSDVVTDAGAMLCPLLVAGCALTTARQSYSFSFRLTCVTRNTQNFVVVITLTIGKFASFLTVLSLSRVAVESMLTTYFGQDKVSMQCC